ncbi:MAG: C-GCAxxG-C-C family protein [Lachnospiraceae bacterium]|nr:C-GCAxxG-C-C family protein [Lachnospiraceae bacterium]
MDLYEKIAELSEKKYHCSQMIMIMMLETIGEEQPQIVQTMGGLGGGIGYSGDSCGCLTGGACAISYFLGKRDPEDMEDPQLKPAVQELVQWFREETEPEYGHSDCRYITDNLNWNVIMNTCPELIAKTYMKVMEILTERGIIEA